MTENLECWAAPIIFATGALAFSAFSSLLTDMVRSWSEKPVTSQPDRNVEAASAPDEPAKKALTSVDFDTRNARPLQPAVAAQRFADWMRLHEFTDYIWVGELDETFLWFCREENYFPIEAKALRELLYQLPGVYWGRPRIGGAAWERFRRQMEAWHRERGLSCPGRPVVVRILPCEVLPSVRVRARAGEARAASGRAAGRVRTSADAINNGPEIKSSRRVHSRPPADVVDEAALVGRVA